MYLPSRKFSHIPPGEKENHLQNGLFRGYVSSQEGIPSINAALKIKIDELLGCWKAASGDGGMETVSLAGSEERLPNLRIIRKSTHQPTGKTPVTCYPFPCVHPCFLCPPSFEELTDLAPVPRLAPVQCLWSWPANRKDEMETCKIHAMSLCFLDTKRCQSTKHIASSRPYQKVHLALAAFLHWAPLQVHQKVLKQPNLIRIRNHTDQNEVCFCWVRQSGLKHVQKLHHPRNLPWCIGDPGGSLHVGCH